MNIYVKRIFIFILLVLVIQFILGCFIEQSMPYYWGNQGLAVKMEALKNSKKTYDTYFIGSSRVRCHIIPSLFDKNNPEQTTSFNLGVPSTQSPESYYFLEHFLKEENQEHTKYIFIELTNLKEQQEHLLNARNLYHTNWELFSLSFHESLRKKSYISATHTALIYLAKTLKIGMIKPMFSFNKQQPFNGFDKANHQIYQQALKQDGFIANDSILAFKGTLHLPKDIDRIEERNKNDVSYYQTRATADWSTAHLAKINALIQLAKSKNIELIFFLSPRILSNSVALFDQIPNTNKLDVGDPGEFPEFYEVAHLASAGHLNEIGAHLFTKALAEKFVDLKNKQK